MTQQFIFRCQLATWSNSGIAPPNYQGRLVTPDGGFFVVADSMRETVLVTSERSEGIPVTEIREIGPVWVAEEDEER